MKIREVEPIPLTTYERLFSKWGYKNLFEKQGAVSIQADPCHDGGILETKTIATRSRDLLRGRGTA